MNVLPTSLALPDPTVLRITWSDGQTREYAVKELRDRCPCATCRDKRSQPREPSPPSPTASLSLPVLSPQEARPLAIEGMKPVGSYAYAIHFSDGHSTGIFTLEHLRQLGKPL